MRLYADEDVGEVLDRVDAVRLAGCDEGEESSAVMAELKAVLTDLNMPCASGIDVVRAARRQRASATIIVVSGSLSSAQARDALEAGAFAGLRKPFDEEQLGAFVRAAAARVILDARHPSSTP